MPRPVVAVFVFALAAISLAPVHAAAGTISAFAFPGSQVRVNMALPPTVGHQYQMCADLIGLWPVEWEIQVRNDGDPPETVQVVDNLNLGLNQHFKLHCPLTLLPPGVDPAKDVVCDETANQFTVSNVVIPGCGRAFIRFLADPGGGTSCTGASVLYGGGAFRSDTQTPLTDQDPSSNGQTCVTPIQCMRPFTIPVLLVSHVAVDENGPPLLPGDTVVYKSYFEHGLSALLGIDRYLENSDGAAENQPLPPYLEFLEWVSKPLEPEGVVYVYDGLRRMVELHDTPSNACPDAIAGPNSSLMEWRGRLDCDLPANFPQCTWGEMRDCGGRGIPSDDPLVYTDVYDPACVVATQPDFGTSFVTVSDANSSNDAQPGEILTFTVWVHNTTPCPDRLMDCECQASGVEVLDAVDVSRLEDVVPLDGGALIAPDRVRWVIPSVGAGGRANELRSVRFNARVKATLRTGDRICDDASVTSAERTNTADGGISNCSTKPPIAIAPPACMDVRQPSAPFLVVEKTVAPPLPPPASGYPVGTTLTFTITVTNLGTQPATNVRAWDLLAPAWAPYALPVIRPLDLGFVCGPAACTGACTPADCTSPRVVWPAIASLAPNASQTFHLEATLQPGLADGSTIPNSAQTRSVEIPSAVASNAVTVPVCAPVLDIQKTLPRTTYGEGEAIEWTITIRNLGSCPASGLTLTDVLDRVRLDDTTLVTTPPGSYNTTTGTVTWTGGPLGGNGAQSLTFKVSARIRAGTAGQQVCNSARLTWDQGVGPIVSSPTTGTCASIDIGCPPLPEVQPLRATKAPARADVHLEWGVLTDARDGYDVWAAGKKTDIPAAKAPGSPPAVRAVTGCSPSTSPSCGDPGVVTDTTRPAVFYQVKGVCGANEGP